MPVRWDAEADRRLLLLVLELVAVDHKKIADAWKEKYGEGGDNPTARGITERLYKLKKIGGGSAGTTPRKASTGPKAVTPSAKKSSTIPKTPASSAKRKKTSMSDEDDSEPEGTMLAHNESPTKRARLVRHSKTPKRYDESMLDEEFEIGDGVPGSSRAADELVGSDQKPGVGNGIGHGEGFGLDTMSDVSDYAPGL